MDDGRKLVRIHLTQAGRAQNGRRRIVFQHGEGIGRLRGMNHVKAFMLQGLRDPASKEDVSVNEQNTSCGGGSWAHGATSLCQLYRGFCFRWGCAVWTRRELGNRVIEDQRQQLLRRTIAS